MRVRPLWFLIVTLGTLAVAGSAAAAGAVVLHGRGELVSQPLTGDLEVVQVRLEPMLVPGGASDLVLWVRNRSALTVTADRVRLQPPLRDAKPAGCLAKVSGPLLRPGGVALAGDARVTLGPGRIEQVVLPSALTLAPGATGGCGFRVLVDVQAVQTPPTTPTTAPPPTTVPTTNPTTTSPTTEPTTATPTGETTTSATPTTPVPPGTPNPTNEPSSTASPTIEPPTGTPSMPEVDCDEADPTCP